MKCRLKLELGPGLLTGDSAVTLPLDLEINFKSRPVIYYRLINYAHNVSRDLTACRRSHSGE